MALWTAADVIAYAPEFCDVAIPLIDKFIMLADGQIAVDCWGSRAKHAGILLTAHMLSVHRVKDAGGAGGAGVGPISSISVGQVSVDYGTSVISSALSRGLDASLSQSVYGLEFSRLVQLSGFWADVV